MKKIGLYVVGLLGICIEGKSQDYDARNYHNRYIQAIERVKLSYVCGTNKRTNQYVHPSALDSGIFNLFSTIALNDANLIKAGTAGSITQDKDKSTLSFNYSNLSKSKRYLLNFGLYANTIGGIGDIFSGNTWAKGAGLTVGGTWLNPYNTRIYDQNKCIELMEKRNQFGRILKRRYVEWLNSYEQLKLDSINAMQIINTEINNTNPQYSSQQLERAYAVIDSTKKILQKLRSQTINIQNLEKVEEQDEAYDEIVSKDFIDFDIKNAPFTGYKLHWLSWDINFGVGSNKLYNDTLKTSDSLLQFRTSDYLRGRFGVSYNFSHSGPKTQWFLSFGISVRNTNFLENRKIAEIPYIQFDSSINKITIKNNEGKSLGSLTELKNSVIAWTPSIYASFFFGKKKAIGIEFNNQYSFFSNKPKDVAMKQQFTSTIGILFRVNTKEELSKGTIGLVGGLINAEEDTHVWKQAFGVQLKVGVPFKAIIN